MKSRPHEVPKHLGHAVRHRRDPRRAAACVRRFRQLFGATAADLVGQPGVKMVAYETANQVTNRGPAFSKEKGLISIWILGMMNAGPQGRDHRSLQARARSRAWPGGQVRLFRRRAGRSAEGHARGRAVPRRRQVPLEDRHLAAPRPATCSARSTSRRAC